ncbi:MAG: glycosyltransferase family 2 protein [Planctomycetes bacterium]|nr:glycosyltransferase family 2 protein [Planctomycetota bacterium]
MYRGRSVTVVVPAYNEEETIGAVVADFVQNELCDEVLVVDNNCKDRTAEIAREHGARVISESKPGYGSALLAGMRAATGEYIVLTEADGSFKSADLIKLIAYLEDAGLVVGTRTTRQMVQQAANMGWMLRWGNVAMAKYLEVCWYLSQEPRFTDVGCTYRALTRETFEKIEGSLTAAGPSFSPEMMCEALMKGCRCVEVPINYWPRLGGESKHSETFWKVAKTAWGMFKIITRKRIRGR